MPHGSKSGSTVMVPSFTRFRSGFTFKVLNMKESEGEMLTLFNFAAKCVGTRKVNCCDRAVRAFRSIAVAMHHDQNFSLSIVITISLIIRSLNTRSLRLPKNCNSNLLFFTTGQV